MNVAMIIAGGVGSRMHANVPKQFIRINDKPIIIYTLEAFERHNNIQAILVVCIEDWIDELKRMAKEYGIKKLKWVVPGGDNGQASARNGVFHLKDILKPQDILIVHDAIRPIVPKLIIDDLIVTAKSHGNACASLPMHETLVITDNQRSGIKSLDRSIVRKVQTPQAYVFKDILWAHEEAVKRGIVNSVYANTMMIELGKEIFFSLGFDNNIKITTPEDIALFKALLQMDEEDLIKR